jgi:hypothetical protein
MIPKTKCSSCAAIRKDFLIGLLFIVALPISMVCFNGRFVQAVYARVKGS